MLLFLLTLLSTAQCLQARVHSTKMTQRVVSTQYGRIRGILIVDDTRPMPPVEAYLGIEYASLLAGKLRFMPPTSPVNKWHDVKPMIKFKPVCPQRLPNMQELSRSASEHVRLKVARTLPHLERQDEDCLYLNVYTPASEHCSVLPPHPVVNQTSLLPVVLFIHGDNYETGTGNSYDGSVMAAYGNLVWVSINYRMGPLGFLSTGDDQAPGNYGLLDQVAALRWVHDNIRAFGGDPERVVLCGQGHGAAMAHMLAVSPVVKGKHLFSQLMLLSGSGLSSWAVQKTPLTYFKQLTASLNCSFEEPQHHNNRNYSYGSYGNSFDKNQKRYKGNDVSDRNKMSDERTYLKNNVKTDGKILPRASTQTPADKIASRSSNLKSLQCLRAKKFEEIVSVQLSWPKYRVAFGPIIDRRTILPSSVKKLTFLNCAKFNLKKRLNKNVNNLNRDLSGSMVSDDKRDSCFGDIPLFIGAVATAGSDFLLQEDLHAPISSLRSAQVLRTFVRNNYRYHRQKIYDILAHNYYDWDRPNNSKASLKSLVDLITDGVFAAPAVKLAEMHSQCGSKSHTFFYSLGSTGLESRSEVLPSQSRSSKQFLSNPLNQASDSTLHSEYISFGPLNSNHSVFFPEGLSSEMAYFLGAPLVNGLDPFLKEFSANERILSENLLKYVFNFVNYGNPNGPRSPKESENKNYYLVNYNYKATQDHIKNPYYNEKHIRKDSKNYYNNHGSDHNNNLNWTSSDALHQTLPQKEQLLEWAAYDTKSFRYLQFGQNYVAMKTYFRSHKMALWNELIPKIHKPDLINPSFHLLEDPTNASTFEAVGSKVFLKVKNNNSDIHNTFQLPNNEILLNNTYNTNHQKSNYSYLYYYDDDDNDEYKEDEDDDFFNPNPYKIEEGDDYPQLQLLDKTFQDKYKDSHNFPQPSLSPSHSRWSQQSFSSLDATQANSSSSSSIQTTPLPHWIASTNNKHQQHGSNDGRNFNLEEGAWSGGRNNRNKNFTNKDKVSNALSNGVKGNEMDKHNNKNNKNIKTKENNNKNIFSKSAKDLNSTEEAVLETGKNASVALEFHATSTLSLTLVVGCALLLLNCIVFAATFCQWHKFGQRMRRRQPETEMLKDKVTIPTTSAILNDRRQQQNKMASSVETHEDTQQKMPSQHNDSYDNHTTTTILNRTPPLSSSSFFANNQQSIRPTSQPPLTFSLPTHASTINLPPCSQDYSSTHDQPHIHSSTLNHSHIQSPPSIIYLSSKQVNTLYRHTLSPPLFHPPSHPPSNPPSHPQSPIPTSSYSTTIV